MKQVFIRTFGCQMNVYDTGKMRALLAKEGYAPSLSMDDADLIIVNTCSVREKPEAKLHGFLGAARRVKKTRAAQTIIAIAGCVAQQEGQKLLDQYKDVDLVFGPDSVPQIVKLVNQATRAPVLSTEFLDNEAYVFTHELDPDAALRVGAFVTIQKGCDNKCTFCIVPSTRGPESSRSSSDICNEVQRLVAVGVKEITLIGQNVNSYGLKVEGEKTFAELLRNVADIEGVERIRYTTSHPRDMGPDVVAAYRDIPELTSQIHLPVQSGSNAVLRRMKRFYTVEHYLEIVAALREARPDIVFSTDFIVGFPGETDADFQATMDLLEQVQFESSFSFKYSPRPETAALRLLAKDLVPPEVAQARLVVLQTRQREISLACHRALEGTTQMVLVEGPSRHDEGVICGRTSSFKMINFPGDLSMVGSTKAVTITTGLTNTLRGRLADGPLAVETAMDQG